MSLPRRLCTLLTPDAEVKKRKQLRLDNESEYRRELMTLFDSMKDMIDMHERIKVQRGRLEDELQHAKNEMSEMNVGEDKENMVQKLHSCKCHLVADPVAKYYHTRRPIPISRQ